MWNKQSAQELSQGFDSVDKSCFDSANGDSGFLSNYNSTSYSCSSEMSLKSMSEDSRPMSTTSMKGVIDSGIELGLSDSLNQLSLKTDELNPLDCISESALISTDSGKMSMITSAEKSQDNSQEPWQLYFTQNEDGDTLLHTAIIQGYVEATLSLIDMAPHPCLFDILNDDAQTALHLAVITNQPKIVRKLVLAGADLSIRNYQGNTSLHLACISGNMECAKALTEPITTLEKTHQLIKTLPERLPTVPQNLEQRNYSGETCLHIASSKGHVDLVNLLVHHGADLDAQESLAGRTALHLALERGCLNVVLYLIHECRPHLDAVTYSGYTAYHIASRIDERLAEELVRCGATPYELETMFEEVQDDFRQATTGISHLGHSPTAARA